MPILAQRQVTSDPSDMYMAIRILHAEPGVVSKDDIGLLLYPFLSFVVIVSLYAALLRVSKIIVAVLTVHAAANVDALYCKHTGHAANMPIS
ncbi:hypothetical protein TNCV_4782041 [Trichonephila clavipes]|nr:hypothetical protein TNCV_4782041 [Trichonephila clavipes]